MLRIVSLVALSLLATTALASEPQVLGSPSSPQKVDYVEISPGQYAPTTSLALKPSGAPALRYADGSDKPISVSESLKLEVVSGVETFAVALDAPAETRRSTKEEVGLGAYIQALHISRVIEKAGGCETLRVHDAL